MKLFKGKSKSIEPDYVAVILLRQEEGVGFVCKIDLNAKSIEIIEERSFTFSNAWENLVYDIDELLFNIENSHSIEIRKATFFMYSHLMDKNTGNLKDAYLNVLKNVIKENNLESLGYIELEESLAKGYSKTEQAPLNAVLVEVDNPAVSAFVYQGGQKTFSESVAKTENIIADLEEIFKRKQKGMLFPARVLMYDSSNLEAETHIILTHPWPEDLFIQLPRVDVVKEHELKQAIIQGVTEELFGTASYSVISPAIVSADLPTNPEDQQPYVEDSEDEIESQQEEIVDEEILSAAAEEMMGFVIGEDVREQSGSTEIPDPLQADQSETTIHSEAEVEEAAYGPYSPDITLTQTGKLSKIKYIMSGITSKIPKLSIGGGGNMLKVGLAVGGIILIFGAVFASLFFFHKATFTVLYKSQPITQDITLSDDIEFTEFTETLDVSASVATTGTQDVGDKAKGEVTIFNADDAERTFEKGTKLETSDGLTFTLNSDITVEAATKTITDEGDVLTSTSKVQANVTAGAIGTKHNIKKDTKMSIDGFSDTTYFARSTQAFTGGSSEKVQTAAKADFTEVDSLIEAELSKKGKEKLAEISEKDNIIDDLTSVNKTDETYSKELSEEADVLEANVTADVTFYSYDDSKIKDIILRKIKDEVPVGSNLSAENITYTIVSADRDEDTEEISIDIEAEARPALKLDKDKLIEHIKGSSLGGIRTDLEKLFNADGFEAEVITPIPFLRSRLPWFSQNITVELKPLTK